MRIRVETLVPIVIVIGVFLLALILLACSLNRSELLDCSIFRCCWRRRRRRNNNNNNENAVGLSDDEDNNGDNPRTYESLNEFIFQTEDEERAGFVAMNDMVGPTETSLQDVFPDILGGGGGGPSTSPSRRTEPFDVEESTNINHNNTNDSDESNNNNNNNNQTNSSNNNNNSLTEPLL